MEQKIKFSFADGEDAAEFFVLEQTRIGGVNYLLVTDSEDDDADAYILKDTSADGDAEALYEMVEDDDELNAVARVFQEMLDDIELI